MEISAQEYCSSDFKFGVYGRKDDELDTKIQANKCTAKAKEPYVIECKQVFQSYYATLARVLRVDELLPDLVSNDLITMGEMEDILSEKGTTMKACALLMGPIWRSINGGYPDAFIKLLCIMQALPNKACAVLSREVCVKLNISDEKIANSISKLNHLYMSQELAIAIILKE